MCTQSLGGASMAVRSHSHSEHNACVAGPSGLAKHESNTHVIGRGHETPSPRHTEISNLNAQAVLI